MLTNKITTAVLLAAGIGGRLRPYTNHTPKCLVEVGGRPILDYTIEALELHRFEKLIIVTGYKEEMIEEYIVAANHNLNIQTICNRDYATTNNIYSLWLAAPLLDESFLLLESDLLFDPESIGHFTRPDKIALDYFDSRIHHGTTADLCDRDCLKNLYVNRESPPGNNLFKTVNIYSFSEDTWWRMKREITELVENGYVNIFYEMAIRNLLLKDEVKLEMVDFSAFSWDEIDTIEDLRRVETLMSSDSRFVMGNLQQEA